MFFCQLRPRLPQLLFRFRCGRAAAVRYMSSLPSTKPATNQHFSVRPVDKIVDVYDQFVSEPLGMPGSMGHGFANLDFGQKIGPNGRYTVERKLGWGMHSSTWLSRDTFDNSFVAVKVCTTYMTHIDRQNIAWESDALHAVTIPPTSPHTIQVLSDFYLTTESGEHLCFVTPFYHGDVYALVARTVEGKLPLPLAKRIVLHLLRGLSHCHSRNIVHADVKLDNIFIDAHASTRVDDTERFLAENPPRRHDPEISHKGMTVQTAVSQNLPMISLENALGATYLLGDFGSAQPSRMHDARPINALCNRPPEVWLEGEWDTPADIWAVGCVAFQLVTGQTLFWWSKAKTWGMSEPQSMLYQMSSKTGDDFTAELLRQWPAAIEYFNPHDCSFKSFVEGVEVDIYGLPFEACIRHVVTDMDKADVDALAAFMRRCLRIDPEARAKAEDLLHDPWFSE